MNCEQTQLVLSTRMDGETGVGAAGRGRRGPRGGLSECQVFARTIGAGPQLRADPAAEPVPDLVEPIMAAVARERVRPSSCAGHRRPTDSGVPARSGAPRTAAR